MLVLPVLFCGCRGGPIGRLEARIDLKKGNQSYLRGDFRTAARFYEDALHHFPHYATADLHRAYSYTNLFRMTEDPEERKRLGVEATLSFSRYLSRPSSHGPSSERIEQHMLTIFMDSGQPEKAVALLEKRLKKDPHDLSALQMLSNIHSDLGNIEGALQLFRKRVELASENPETHHALAVFAWSISYHGREPDSVRVRAIVEEGLQAAEAAMRLKPDYFEAITYANLLYREKAKGTADPTLQKQYTAKADSLRQMAMKLRPASKAAS